MVAEPDRSIGFVETHYHLWELGRLRYAWLDEPGIDAKTAYLGDYRALREDWGPARLATAFEGSNVIGAVHVEADHSGTDPVAETAWLATVASDRAMPNAIVAYADLERDGVEATLDRHLAASELVRGIRIREHPADPTSAAFRRGLRALSERGLSYDLNASVDRLASGRATALGHPDLQVVLCHTGDPPRRDPDAFATWRREMDALAEAPNVACKISGLGMGDHAWTVESIRPWVLGADRVVRCRAGHVRDELAGRFAVRDLPRAGRRVPDDHRRRGLLDR